MGFYLDCGRRTTQLMRDSLGRGVPMEDSPPRHRQSKWRDSLIVLVVILPWTLVLGVAMIFLLALFGISERTRGPAPASIVTIVIIASSQGLFARWAKQRSPIFWTVTVIAYLLAGLIIWGSQAGWLHLPQ